MKKDNVIPFDRDGPVFPDAICKAGPRYSQGTLAGYSHQLAPKYKELVTSSARLSPKRESLRSAAKASKMGARRK
jgi:hypothetical protein